MAASSLRILADENIPLVQEAFGGFGTVCTMPGRRITPEAVRDADVLLVRSVTPVNAALIEGSPLRFVGSATIGTDHVDQAALQAQGIAFAHAPGSNAESVVEYVLAALLHLASQRGVVLRDKTVGVVGCGNIGGRLVDRLLALGLRVLQNDPPLAARAVQRGEQHDFVSLDAVITEADIVTLHVPLTYEGPHATYHLFDKTTLNRLKPEAWLLNTGRGAVVDNTALRDIVLKGRLGAVVLDVWEQEPTPDPVLMDHVDLATPHIAGYSYDGKLGGTCMLYEALLQHLNFAPTWDDTAALAPTAQDHLTLTPPDATLSETAWLHALVCQMYDLATDDAHLRDYLNHSPEEQGGFFSGLRKRYPRRRTFRLHTLDRHAVPEAYHAAVARGLQVQWSEG